MMTTDALPPQTSTLPLSSDTLSVFRPVSPPCIAGERARAADASGEGGSGQPGRARRVAGRGCGRESVGSRGPRAVAHRGGDK